MAKHVQCSVPLHVILVYLVSLVPWGIHVSFDNCLRKWEACLYYRGTGYLGDVPPKLGKKEDYKACEVTETSATLWLFAITGFPCSVCLAA